MDFLNDKNGQSRVIIGHVCPKIEGGRYAIKAIISDKIKVNADILCNGYDHISAFLKYKKNGAENWSQTRMQPIYGDRFEANFTVDLIGFHKYCIEAFVDNGNTWLHEILLKIKEIQLVDLELLIGAEIIEKMIDDGANISTIKVIKKLFIDKNTYKNAIEFIKSPEMADLIYNFPHRQYVSNPNELKLWVDHKKAGVSAWYSMFPRSAADDIGQHGSFNDVVKNVLPKVKQIGIDVLYIPPIHPIRKAFRKDKNNNSICEEGEPESSITDRKIKYSPLKDVAGMIRSYHYAISAKFFNSDSLKNIDLTKVAKVPSAGMG